jgi:predicted DNA-binding protein YlxM (UPF0122 family)
MDNKKRILELAENKYQVIFGIRKPTFLKMLSILESAFKELHKQGGRPSRLSVLDKLIIMLGYYHDYRTMENIAFEYGVSKSRISDAVKWVEKTLLESGEFSLPSKRELKNINSSIVAVIVDVTECETERPKNGQKKSYSGKKKNIQSKTKS